MQTLLTDAFVTALISGAVTAAVPLLLAGLGEQISEKAGVLNIGIEGMMLLGWYTGFLATWMSGSFALGFLGGGLGGVAVAALMVLLCVRQGLNQIVIGIALTLGIQGLTALLYFARFAGTYPRLEPPPVWPLPLLSRIPVLGPGLFKHDILCYLGVLLVPLLALLYRRSAVGLNLEAAGNAPAALDVAGDLEVTRQLRQEDVNVTTMLRRQRVTYGPMQLPPSCRTQFVVQCHANQVVGELIVSDCDFLQHVGIQRLVQRVEDCLLVRPGGSMHHHVTGELAADDGRDTHVVKKVRREAADIDGNRDLITGKIFLVFMLEENVVDGRHPLEFQVAGPVDEQERAAEVGLILAAHLYVDHAVGVFVGIGIEEYAIDNAKDSGGGADAEHQGKHGGNHETGRFAVLP